ncbi:hypothetical protein HG536_0A01080 [Torulaspora globosa]|uniref:PEX18/PEX21 C-terminal domain-containing protein n=1 Tax=Torulaspora globosa TaxID=48254 RepID=A0A7G3Z9V5_9SACH|nr:uncharacterized protein HG536_0A01080 [Torulaspora globosa]QLL30291.1 hypothetical protein HG536_0A01080 [Torulaspora globosa]
MSASCQVNPLQQFVSKGDSAQGRGFGFSAQQRPSEQQPLPVEYSFLHEQEGALQGSNMFLAVQQPSSLSHLQASPGPASRSWLNQFSSMKLEDPLSFDSDYRKHYANYESQQLLQTRQRLSNMSPTLNRTMYYQPVNSYFRPPPAEGQPMTDASDSRLDEEFQSLEAELQKENPGSQDENVGFDDEQVEFQRIASEIVESCSSTSHSPSPVSSKLYSSKFMTLMRNVSEGSVTLSRGNSTHSAEFHSSDGEVIGNEFSPVADHVHELS